MSTLGTSLVTAIEEKYKMDDCELDIQIFGLPKKTDNDASDIIVPTLLCVPMANVTHAGDPGELQKLCSNVIDLDLEENSISDWREVFKILEHVPKCTILSLRGNPLSEKIVSDSEGLPTFEKINKLVLNSTPVPLQSVWELLPAFPRVKDLYLSLNEYGSVNASCDRVFESVECLHFRSNAVSDWQDIAKLGQLFPNLVNLVILDNPLQTFSSAKDISTNFQNLKTLNISDTKIKDWHELEKFRYFPCLKELRVQDIPLFKDYSEDLRRQLLLSYLPNVTLLNGSTVEEGEKEDAERGFIRHYLDTPEEQRPERYFELEKKHGKLTKLVSVSLKPQTTVTLEIQVNEGTSVLKPCNVQWTVPELKRYLAAEFPATLDARKPMQIKLISWGDYPIDFMFKERTLLRYGAEDGHKLLVFQ